MKNILDDIGQGEYKKKVLNFSKRIDNWHLEQTKLNTGIFEDDGDFVELDRSPSKFSMPADQSSLDDFILGNQDEESKTIKEIAEIQSP